MLAFNRISKLQERVGLYNEASDQGQHCSITGFSIKNRIKETK